MEYLFICLSPIYVIVAVVLGRYLPLWLPRVHRALDCKPFNCRPCTTFHLCWMMFAAGAAIAGCPWLMGGGVIIAFVVFFIVKYIDNQKIEE